MSHHVCPWWLGYVLLNPWRRYRQNPSKILRSYAREGVTVLEPGPGMGFFTLELARLVGRSGKVIAVDIQPRMIEKLRDRATKAGLMDRIEVRVAQPGSMGIVDLADKIDFTLAFAVVHEFPDARSFFAEVAAASKDGASLLMAEPKGHVNAATFEGELQAASAVGWDVVARPIISGSRTALLKKRGEQ